MPTEDELRNRIVARAREALTHGVKADVPDGGFRTGWRFLQRYFSVAPSCGPFDNIKKYAAHRIKKSDGSEGLTYHIAPDWCGIFALWCLHAARPDEFVGYWVNGSAIQVVAGVERIPVSRIQPGDVGVMSGSAGHHVLITEVIGNPPTAVRTIEGNSGSHSEVTQPSEPKQVNRFVVFASIFAADSPQEVEKRLLGNWNVKIDWKPWVYIFTRSNRVGYAEPSAPRKALGSGTWSTDGKKLVIAWDTGSQEVWDLPLPHTRQSATGTWRDSSGRTTSTTYRKMAVRRFVCNSFWAVSIAISL